MSPQLAMNPIDLSLPANVEVRIAILSQLLLLSPARSFARLLPAPTQSDQYSANSTTTKPSITYVANTFRTFFTS